MWYLHNFMHIFKEFQNLYALQIRKYFFFLYIFLIESAAFTMDCCATQTQLCRGTCL